MRNLHARPNQSKIILRLVILSAILCSFVASPLLSSAKPQSNSVTITNNSGREIRYVYFSPVENDNWGPNQLNGTISSGGSATINISSTDSQVKVVAEDADGCFLYHTVSTSGDSTWTITNADAPDCGS